MVVLVVVAIAAGVGAGRSRAPVVLRPVEPTDAAQLPRRAAHDRMVLPGHAGVVPAVDQTVTLTNFGSSGARGGGHRAPRQRGGARRAHRHGPRDSVRTFERSDVAERRPSAPLPNGPIVVEPFSPDVVVSAGLERSDALATVPCASTAATDWYFAAGTTVRGVSQWLVLDDPFAADARVDVTLRTDSGLQLLPSLSGLDVPGRSRVVIPIHDEAVRQQLVAVEVHAAVGRVVASQTLQFRQHRDRRASRRRSARSRPRARGGSPAATPAQARRRVAIADVGQLDARVNVQAQTGSKAIVRPVEVTVPSGGVSLVRIGGCSATKATCLGRAAGPASCCWSNPMPTPIVAQTLSRFEGSRKGTAGAATSMGSTAPARRWVIPRTRVLGERSTTIALTNPGVDPHASVGRRRARRPGRPAGITAAPDDRIRERAVIPFGAQAVLRRVDAGVVVTSDVPVFAESTIYAERDATRAPGIPSRWKAVR